MDADNFKTDGKLDKIRKDRGYSYEDEVWKFEKKIKFFGRIHWFLTFIKDNMLRRVFTRLCKQVENVFHRALAFRWRDPFRCRWVWLFWCTRVSLKALFIAIYIYVSFNFEQWKWWVDSHQSGTRWFDYYTKRHLPSIHFRHQCEALIIFLLSELILRLIISNFFLPELHKGQKIFHWRAGVVTIQSSSWWYDSSTRISRSIKSWIWTNKIRKFKWKIKIHYFPKIVPYQNEHVQ